MKDLLKMARPGADDRRRSPHEGASPDVAVNSAGRRVAVRPSASPSALISEGNTSSVHPVTLAESSSGPGLIIFRIVRMRSPQRRPSPLIGASAIPYLLEAPAAAVEMGRRTCLTTSVLPLRSGFP